MQKISHVIFLLIILSHVSTRINAQQCNATASANGGTAVVDICYGDQVTLSATGGCPNYVLNNDFNNGTPGTGWSATNQAMFTNPCAPHSPDGTIYMWMGSTSTAPRILTTIPFDVSTGGTIQFEMRYAVQSQSSPCEGPDLYNEGIAVEYSINGGSNWSTIAYYAPNGNILSNIPGSTSPGTSGQTPFTVWTTQTLTIPAAAQTISTMFRWAQTASTSAVYDHWGLDNVSILVPPPTINVWWSHGATGFDPPAVTPLSTTTYTVYVSDGATTAQSSVVVNVNPIPDSPFTVTTPVCEDEMSIITYTGTASASASYNWDFVGGTVISGTGQGPYQVLWANSGNKNVTLTVTENGCSSAVTTMQVVVNPNPIPTGLNYNPVCINNTLQLQSDNVAGATYTWTGPSGFSSNVQNPSVPNFIAINEGYYVLSLIDGNGCTASDSILVNLSPNPVADAGQDVTICIGEQAILSASGGATYQWSTGQTGSDITVTPLLTTTYTVTVANDFGCTDSDNVVVNVIDINNAFTVNNVLCNGGNSGSLIVTPSGGISPYSYQWSTGETNASISNLPIGTYTVTVTDNNGCVEVSTQIISEPPAMTSQIANITNVSCYLGNDGTALLNINGGTLPYSYNWSPAGGNGNPGVGFSEGTYYVTITDVNYCTAYDTVTITQPEELISSITEHTDASCFGSSDGSAVSEAEGGTLPYYFNWNTNPPQYIQNPVNMSAGTYTLSVTDANGCLSTSQVTIGQPPDISIILNPVNEHCLNSCDGEITSNISGGTPPYQYSWSNSEQVQNISDLCANTYTITVTDSVNCTKTASVDILTNTFINASAIFSPETGGSPLNVQFTYTGSTAATYEWDFGDGSAINNDQNPIHTYIVDGEVPETFTITLNVNTGFPDYCEDTYTLSILVHPPSSLEIPNVFTPNGDGYNDNFEIKSISIETMEVTIYNRWGKKVAEWNSIDGKWDGTINSGATASEGTYYYILKAKGIDNIEYDKQGTVSLVR